MSFSKSSLFIHAGLLPPLSDFLLIKGRLSFSLEEVFLENQPALLESSSLQDHIPQDLPKQTKPKSGLPKFRFGILLFVLLSPLSIPNYAILCLLKPRQPLTFITLTSCL